MLLAEGDLPAAQPVGERHRRLTEPGRAVPGEHGGRGGQPAGGGQRQQRLGAADHRGQVGGVVRDDLVDGAADLVHLQRPDPDVQAPVDEVAGELAPPTSGPNPRPGGCRVSAATPAWTTTGWVMPLRP